MAKSKLNVAWKKDKNFEYVYLKNVPVVYASVQEPKLKYQTEDEYEYAMTAFITDDDRKYLEDEVIVNKQLYKVGVDKNKLRKIKYQTSEQRQDDNDTYDAYIDLNGISLTCPALTKRGTERKVIVVDKDGEPFTDLVGNGSVVTVKLSGYRNKDDLLNVTLSVVQVLEHVSYEGGSGVIEDEEMGISIDTSKFKSKKPSDKIKEEFDDAIPFEVDDDDGDDY